MQDDTITYRYFVAEGPAATAAMEAASELLEAQRARIRDCLQKYGADCLWGGRGSAPIGIGFKCAEIKPSMKENFLKPTIKRPDGERFAVYKPDQRYKAGKAIKQDLLKVGAFSYSGEIVKRLGVNREAFGVLNGQHVLAHTGAGLYGSTLVIRIPDGGHLTREQGQFVPPSFLREIKKSEFIAITEEGAQAAA